ncbi:hypothetical protein L3X38_001429 [Prunus dulcis]|uniref:Uncharacterized protein n=1 Tax=Prunus dulcis TaxID=3755 RepID=A0AAD4WUJ8_PRUDU|nr:hypothetical protein L3X38_001429 [Prunus dulcis]
MRQTDQKTLTRTRRRPIPLSQSFELFLRLRASLCSATNKRNAIRILIKSQSSVPHSSLHVNLSSRPPLRFVSWISANLVEY